jgi:hypothetical protein
MPGVSPIRFPFSLSSRVPSFFVVNPCFTGTPFSAEAKRLEGLSLETIQAGQARRSNVPITDARNKGTCIFQV